MVPRSSIRRGGGNGIDPEPRIPMTDPRDDAASSDDLDPAASSPPLRLRQVISGDATAAPDPTRYHVFLGGETAGPFSPGEVEGMIRSGQVGPLDLARREGDPEWFSLGEMFPDACLAVGRGPGPQATVPPSGTDRQSFTGRLFGALAYPFCGDGAVIFGSGVVFILLMGVMASFSGMIAMILSFVVTGYFFGALQGIVQSSAQGIDTMPPWPGTEDWTEEIAGPFLRWVVTLATCFGPGAAVCFWGWKNTDTLVLWAGVGLGLLGLVVYPMAVLAVSMADSIAGLHPFLVIRSIAASPGRYLAVVALITLLIGVQVGTSCWAEKLPVPFVGDAWHAFNGLYFAVVQARLLGVFYHANRERLGWF